MIIITSKSPKIAFINLMTRFFPIPAAKRLKAMLLGIALVGLGLAFPAMAQSPSVVGVASLMSGKATLTGKSGAVRPIGASTQVVEGDTIETTESGYVYINTQDQGFISVRPSSKVVIDLYRYDARRPSETQIRWTLAKGVVRVVSGKGMEASRERFRLNTPLVAIGIRGTDFSVFSDTNVTRAFVTSGAIVVSPFNDQCAKGGLGSCGGPAGLALTPGDFSLAQFRVGDQKPELLRSLDLSPDRIAPPRPDESAPPKGSASSPAKADVTPHTPSNVTPSVQTAVAASSAAPVTSTQGSSVTSAEQVFSAQTKQLINSPGGEIKIVPSAPAVHWGRWSPIAGLPSNATQNIFGEDKQLTAILGEYGLSRNKGALSQRPERGNYSFILWDHEAFLVDDKGVAVSPGSIKNAELTVDFGKDRFATKFDFVSGDLRMLVASQGDITKDGKLYNDSGEVNALIRGALAGERADQAGYLFRKKVPGSTNSAVGVTRWVR